MSIGNIKIAKLLFEKNYREHAGHQRIIYPFHKNFDTSPTLPPTGVLIVVTLLMVCILFSDRSYCIVF